MAPAAFTSVSDWSLGHVVLSQVAANTAFIGLAQHAALVCQEQRLEHRRCLQKGF